MIFLIMKYIVMGLTPPAFNNYVFLLNLFAKVLLRNLNTQNYAD